jgi:hypothetical protein
VPAIVTALQEVYEETKGGRVDRGAVSAAMERYDQVKVYEQDWKPLIELMTARKRRPADQPNRAQRRASKNK